MPLVGAAVLKRGSESPGNPKETQISGPQPQSFLLSKSESEEFVSLEFLGDAVTAESQTTL